MFKKFFWDLLADVFRRVDERISSFETEKKDFFGCKYIILQTFVQAKELMKKDVKLMGKGTSDPYAILTVGATAHKTPTRQQFSPNIIILQIPIFLYGGLRNIEYFCQ